MLYDNHVKINIHAPTDKLTIFCQAKECATAREKTVFLYIPNRQPAIETGSTMKNMGCAELVFSLDRV